ncbi:MAG TPA: DUF554 domain-containing protein [Clostridiales bacterium]|nr:DUF554 domain-containing protein [Clostridiales bacterium]
MIGIGTIVNIAAIIIGSLIGMIFKGGLKQRFQDNIMNALGLAVMFIGISGALQGLLIIKDSNIESTNIILMIISLAIGAFVGELIDIEEKLERLGMKFKNIFKLKKGRGQNFVEGFVTSSLLFCVGAMAITGALQDGLIGDPTTLLAKSFLDGIAAIIFTSTLGIGVMFSVIPLGLYQGGITISAKYLEPFLNETLKMNISFIGSILIFAIGINMVFGKKIKCGNLLPAILIPIIYEIFIKII